MVYTYQDYEQAKNDGQELAFITKAISEYRSTPEYKTAQDADEYEAERNVTIVTFIKYMFALDGRKIPDPTAANNKIASNFFHRLTTQRVAYSLGNGISFPSAEQVTEKGKIKTVDRVKEKLGKRFDNVLYKAGKAALQHGVSFLFWNLDHARFFKMTEFLPLYDEDDGRLRAGFRFWSLDWNKRPVTVVVYEENGYTKYRTRKGGKGLDLVLAENKRAYKQKVAKTKVDPEEIVAESNYTNIPIVPLWGSDKKQSDLVGMRSKIDAYDLIKSGFADDLEECAEIYWIVGNAMGETDDSLKKFRDRLKMHHIAVADTENSPVTPYTQEIPTNARKEMLDGLRAQLYEDYGGLDVHTIAAGATNDHIDAAYQPMDEEADDFEYQVIEAVQGILALMGIEDVPLFHRNRVSNKMEQTQMVIMSADHLDEETIVSNLPFITPDEVPEVLARKQAEDMGTFTQEEEPEETPETEEIPEGV